MENTYRREEAESFVRRNSDKVAADLPDNEMAQFLAKTQRQEIDLKNREINGMAKDFSHWLATENLDRFVAVGPTKFQSTMDTNNRALALRMRRCKCYSRSVKSW